VTEPTTNISDEAIVELRDRPYGPIASINIYPSYLRMPRGTQTFLTINCYDSYGNRITNYLLRYWVTDYFGRRLPINYIVVESPGVLRVSPFVPSGPYRIYFQDANGFARTEIRLDVF